MGGENVTNQLIEYVHSYDPRGWSCLHVTEGSDNCRNSTVQYNDIGPCGTDTFQQWADGISMACRESVVRHNMIHGATDGGIVLFGAPGTQVYNNTIWVWNVGIQNISSILADVPRSTLSSAASIWLIMRRSTAILLEPWSEITQFSAVLQQRKEILVTREGLIPETLL